jgi:hypothetical protein
VLALIAIFLSVFRVDGQKGNEWYKQDIWCRQCVTWRTFNCKQLTYECMGMYAMYINRETIWQIHILCAMFMCLIFPCTSYMALYGPVCSLHNVEIMPCSAYWVMSATCTLNPCGRRHSQL